MLDLESTPPEFRYLLLCCRWPDTAACDEQLRLDATRLDWPLLQRIAHRHRVQNLLHRRLKRAGIYPPTPVAAALKRAAQRVTAANLLLTHEADRLKWAFADANIPLLFVKGTSLAKLAYGDACLKDTTDIDLLIDPETLIESSMLLDRLGYRHVIPSRHFDIPDLIQWHAHSKESVWLCASRPVQIDLHTSLTDHPMLLHQVDVHSPRQDVHLAGGISISTLDTEELFAYLCVHGASSAWFRLKWVADLAAWLTRFRDDDVSRLYARSQELGAGRAADAALLICSSLFGTRLAADLRRSLETKRANRWLVRAAFRSMAGRTLDREVTGTPLGTMWIHLSQFMLKPGMAYKWSRLGRDLRAVTRSLLRRPR